VASILVYIERDGESPGCASVEALGEARRMATHLGAVLHAFVSLSGPVRDQDEDCWVPVLGLAGADKVILMSGAGEHDGPLPWLAREAALYAACARIAPRLMILAATPEGRDMAPGLAARTGAAFLAEPGVDHDEGGAPVLRLDRTADSAQPRSLALHQHSGPVVITLRPGAHQPASGYDEAEYLCMDMPRGDEAQGMRLDSSEDPAVDSAGVAARLVEDSVLR
jgi:electron transfer flavoprotein alpha subunit